MLYNFILHNQVIISARYQYVTSRTLERTLGTRLPFDLYSNENIRIKNSYNDNVAVVKGHPHVYDEKYMNLSPRRRDSFDISRERTYLPYSRRTTKRTVRWKTRFKMSKRPIKRVDIDSIFAFQTITAFVQ